MLAVIGSSGFPARLYTSEMRVVIITIMIHSYAERVMYRCISDLLHISCRRRVQRNVDPVCDKELYNGLPKVELIFKPRHGIVHRTI